MDNNHKNPPPQKPNPEGDKPKNIGAAIIISLALILVFTWCTT